MYKIFINIVVLISSFASLASAFPINAETPTSVTTYFSTYSSMSENNIDVNNDINGDDDEQVIIPELIFHLSEQYKKLRNLQGAVDGATFNPQVDAINGVKHQVMEKLYKHFLHPMIPKESVLDVLGEPDRVGLPEDVTVDKPIPRIVGQFWVYKWRGMHDFLWVYMTNSDVVMTAGWHLDEETAEAIKE